MERIEGSLNLGESVRDRLVIGVVVNGGTNEKLKRNYSRWKHQRRIRIN